MGEIDGTDEYFDKQYANGNVYNCGFVRVHM